MFGAGAATSTDVWDAMGEKAELIAEMMKKWEEQQLDSVICNVFPFPAPLVDAPGMLPSKTSISLHLINCSIN